MSYRRVAALKTPQVFQAHLAELGIHLPFEEQVVSGSESPFAQSYRMKSGFNIGNRFCILPMEGWDGTLEGHPSELTVRRWHNFGLSGAKLIWGCEATAVRPDGRANPNQLMINPETLHDLADLRQQLVDKHTQKYGRADDLLIGLQLTHSGRFARPWDKKQLDPKILYHHPYLDAKFNIPSDYPVMTDAEIDALVEDFVKAAVLAQQAGFSFVDIKHCHGYLGHEFLTAKNRPGKYGGSFENRTRFLRRITAGIRRQAPGLEIAVRLSAFDFLPFRPGSDGVGEPVNSLGAYSYAFGADATGLSLDLTEPQAFLDLFEALGIELVCITGGSPYYNPHIQRPAIFPPSDGYQPPEDPLVGVARQIEVTAALKQRHPELAVVGSAYTYLQEYLPHVAQAVIRSRKADFIGLGRMALAYPELPDDILQGKPLQRKRFCRTFSDCTTAPRNGLVSGCYPLDPFYKSRPEAVLLSEAKRE